MATNWVLDTDVKRFLLANGQVIDSPPMECTTSTRPRYRFLGETDSFGSNQIKNELIQRLERQHGAKVIQTYADPLEVRNMLAQALGRADYAELQQSRADIGNITPRGAAQAGQAVQAWARFAHESLPLEAIVQAQVQWWYGHINLSVQTVVRSTHVINRDEIAVLVHSGGSWGTPPGLDWNKHNYGQVRMATQAADPPFVNNMPHDQAPSIQKGVQYFNSTLRTLNDLAEIRVPYWSDETNNGPDGYLTLKQVESNITGELLGQLANFTNNRESLAKVARAHLELTRALREIGMVIHGEADEDGLIAMLSSGANHVEIDATADDRQGHDRDHSVRINLLTGTVVVNCTAENGSRNRAAIAEAAQLWEVARFQADIAGVEDELLAYARESVRRQAIARAEEIEGARLKELNA